MRGAMRETKSIFENLLKTDEIRKWVGTFRKGLILRVEYCIIPHKVYFNQNGRELEN